MLSKKIQVELNQQINMEYWSGYLYLSMAAYLEDNNLPGFSNWMRMQYLEELSHALKIFDYINEREGRVELKPIDKVKTAWKDVTEVFSDALVHEKKVSERVNFLVNLAIDEKDHPTNNMLQWFVSEQVEEEANTNNILQQLKMLDGNKYGLLMLDRELQQRAFTDETLEK